MYDGWTSLFWGNICASRKLWFKNGPDKTKLNSPDNFRYKQQHQTYQVSLSAHAVHYGPVSQQLTLHCFCNDQSEYLYTRRRSHFWQISLRSCLYAAQMALPNATTPGKLNDYLQTPERKAPFPARFPRWNRSTEFPNTAASVNIYFVLGSDTLQSHRWIPPLRRNIMATLSFSKSLKR
jgi:hypothetical protein